MPPALQKKIAGLPAWAWLMGAVVAIGFGLYLRRKGADASSASSGTSGMDDLANALAGGATAEPPTGLDPATADLLANAQNALLQQSQFLADSAAASGYGAYTDTFGGDYGGYDTGFDQPATVNVASSPAGTVSYAIGPQLRSYFAAKQGVVTQPIGLVHSTGAVSAAPQPTVVGVTHPIVATGYVTPTTILKPPIPILTSRQPAGAV